MEFLVTIIGPINGQANEVDQTVSYAYAAMLSVFQSIPQPLWLIESNLMQASLLTPLSWILLLGHERKEQTWSSFLWAWRSEWCLFSMAISTERLCHWRFKCPFAIHRLLRRLSIPYTRLPLEKYVFPRTRTESTNDPYRANLYLFFNPHVFGNFRHFTFVFMSLIVSISRRQPCVISVLSVLRFYAR